jgi:hypothetical protein
MGSIPIACSINPVDAVEFTGFLPPKFTIKTRVLDAVIPSAAGISDATIRESFTSPIRAFIRS